MVVKSGIATGVALAGWSRELLGVPSPKKPTHENLYGAAPPVTVAWSCEVWPGGIVVIVVGLALAETFRNGKILTVLSAFMTTVHCVRVKESHPTQATKLASAVRITLVPAGKIPLQLTPLKQPELPGRLGDTKRFGLGSSIVSVNDEPRTLTCTDLVAVCPTLSRTVNVYVVVKVGLTTGAGFVESLPERFHEKVYGGAPPFTIAWSCEDCGPCPRVIVVGLAVTETCNGETVVTTMFPVQRGG